MVATKLVEPRTLEGSAMSTRSPRDKFINTNGLLDLVEEIRLRTWARLNYTTPESRDSSWHPIILEEMETKDVDLAI
jgi:hypothetical protein